MSRKHLAIDIGADTGRAICGEIRDGVLMMEEIYRFSTRDMLVRGSRRRDIYRWYEEILHALQEYVRRYGPDLDSVGVDALGCEFSLIDQKGELINLPLSSRNEKEFDHIALLEKEVGRKRLYSISGNQLMNVDTLNRLLLLREEEPEKLERAQGILFLADIIHYLLGSRPCCERSLATYFHLYDQGRNCWSDELFERLALPKTLQPEIVTAGQKIGQLREDICREVGLLKSPAIITPASHDTADAVISIPAEGEDWMFLSSGSWSLIGIETDRVQTDDAAFSINASNSASALGRLMYKKNVSGMWLIQQCYRAWGCESYDEIVRVASGKEAEGWIDIDSMRFFYTDDMPRAVCADVKEHFGVEVSPDDVGMVARIIYESMALKDRYVIERILKTVKRVISRLYIVGGGSKNGLLNQMIANVTGLQVCTGAAEATSMGNLLLQAYGCGELDDLAALRKVAGASIDMRCFAPEDMQQWNEKYQRYLCGVNIENRW